MYAFLFLFHFVYIISKFLLKINYGVRDGVRSRNIRSHSAALYQLSYSHQVYTPNLVSHYGWQEDFPC